MPVPWISIFKSLPAWSIGVTTFGRIWVHYVFIMSGPMYMKHILGFSIQENGFLSGTPFLCSYLSSVFFCWAADSLVNRQLLTLNTVRKMFTASSQIIPGILVLLVGYLGTTVTMVLFMWFIAVTMITASYAGAMASIVDIAPNLAGPVLAFAQTIHMSASFLSPIANGMIITDPNDLGQWQISFVIAFFVACSTYSMFQIYGTSGQPTEIISSILPTIILLFIAFLQTFSRGTTQSFRIKNQPFHWLMAIRIVAPMVMVMTTHQSTANIAPLSRPTSKTDWLGNRMTIQHLKLFSENEFR